MATVDVAAQQYTTGWIIAGILFFALCLMAVIGLFRMAYLAGHRDGQEYAGRQLTKILMAKDIIEDEHESMYYCWKDNGKRFEI